MSDNTAATEGSTEATQTQEVKPGPMDQQPKVFDEAYVKELRSENAGLRVSKKEAVEAAVKAANESHAAELVARDARITELETDLGKAWIELQKLYTAVDAKVPSDKVRAFTEILKGEDAESIAESAKSGLELFGGFDSKSPAYDPSQGRGGKPPIPLNGDPILAAINSALGIK